jgi:hypothetical protein
MWGDSQVLASYLNPLELLFNDLKQHHIRPNFPKNGESLTKSKIAALVRGYMHDRAPTALSGFFKARANGKDAVEKKNPLIAVVMTKDAKGIFQSAAVLYFQIHFSTYI